MYLYVAPILVHGVSGLAGDAAEFSRAQFFHGALMLQPQDEE